MSEVTPPSSTRRMFLTKYKWLGFAIMVAAAIPGLVSGALAFKGLLTVEETYVIVTWCVAIALIGWALHMVVVVRQLIEKHRREHSGPK